MNTQKPFFEHEIMQNAIWNMEKTEKKYENVTKKCKIMVKKPFFCIDRTVI